MNRFTLARPGSLGEALELLAAPAWKDARLKAGGIDLLDHMKEGLASPAQLIDLRAVPALSYVKPDGGALRLGATTTLADIEAHPTVRDRFGALAEAAASAATPQIRNMATVAGNLLQRPRCWYYRLAEFQCLKKGGATCLAKEGEHRYHAVLGGGPVWIVHPSTMATALVAFGARLRLATAGTRAESEIALEDFFILPTVDPERENKLAPNQVVTEIVVPAPAEGTRSAFLAVKERAAFDWPLGEVAVALGMRGPTIASARVVLGQAAPIPWRSREAEAALVGKPLTEDTARAAGEAALKPARPLRDNAYKVPLLATLVARTIMAAGGRS